MDRLLRFDDEGDPSVDPDPAAGSAEPDPAPAEAWGQGAAERGDTGPGLPGDGVDAVVHADPGLDEGPGEGSWDVFWDRSLEPTGLDGLEADPFESDPFGTSGEPELPAPGNGADDVDLDVDLVDDPGAGEGEMGAGPV